MIEKLENQMGFMQPDEGNPFFATAPIIDNLTRKINELIEAVNKLEKENHPDIMVK